MERKNIPAEKEEEIVRMILELPLVKTAGDVTWEENLAELAKMSTYPSADTPLGVWVAGQRKLYRKGRLPPERIEKLNEIGFNWGKEKLDSWEKRRRELEACISRTGSYPEEDTPLAAWVRYQRKVRDQMRPERRNKLDEMGFVWSEDA